MKGYLANPTPFKGLDNAIRENKYLLFYADIVNHRKLNAKEFFEYINNKYGNNYKIMKKIDYMSYNISSYKANKLKLIIKYKEAELDNKLEEVQSLKSEFKKIKKVEVPKDNIVRSNALVKKNGEEKVLFNIDKLKEDLNNSLDKYLNDEIDLSDRELINLNARLLNHMSIIDYKKYIDFIIKRKQIKAVSLKDIDQIIEVLEYFINNLNRKLYNIEFCNYIIKAKKDEISCYDKEIKCLKKNKELCKDEIELQINDLMMLRIEANKILNHYINIARSIYIKGEENLDISKKESISKLIIWKYQRIRSYLKNYKSVLEYLINFKNAVTNNDRHLLQVLKINSYQIEEDFIIEMIKDISKVLYGYKRVSNICLSDSKVDNAKEDYLKKVYNNK